jgi:thiamine transport system permease protein
LTTSLELFLTTAFISVVSAALSVLVGVPFGSWLRSLSPQLARGVSTLTLIPFLLPPLLVGLAFVGVFGEQKVNSNIGMLLVIAAHVFMNFGFIAKVFAGSTIESQQIEAARLDGASDNQVRSRVEFPQQLPGLISASLLVALYSATSFGLVLTLGAGQVKTLETEIAIATLQQLDLERAGLYAALQTLLTVAIFLFSKRISGSPSPLDQIEKTILRPALFDKSLGLTLSALVFVAIGFVVSKAFTGPGLITNLANLSTKGERELLNITVLDASINSIRNALFVVLVAVPVAYLLASRKRPSGWVLIPIGLSPVVIGLATLALAGYLPRALTSSWVLLPLIQVLFALPVAYQILRPARLSIDRDVLEASALDGAGRFQRVSMIELPLIKKSVALATAFSAMVSIGEFGAASFLAFGSNETLPIVLFKLLGRPGEESLGMAMTVAAIYILISAYVIWLSLKPVETQRHFSSNGQRLR